MKIDKKDILHIAIIILGIIFLAIPIFHSGLWFDEAYSVSLANHTFTDIWSIDSHDVHPVLYYWVLHIINLIFGNNIILYRVFSYVCSCLIGIIGFTHIRKDFGKNVGILFSFFSLFTPVIVMYAGEIRMYSFAMLLVTIMCIYAYRIFKNQDKKQIKNWLIFTTCSLASAYTHYYGLMAAGIVNIILFTYIIKKLLETKQFSNSMKAFIISAVVQITIYIPWVLTLLRQISQVSKGFWIEIKPTIVIDFLTFQLTGKLENNVTIINNFELIFSLIIFVHLIYLCIRNRKNKIEDKEYKNLIRLSLGIYFSIIIAATIISLIIFKPIIYARYMLCVTGVFIFFMAYYLAKRGNKNIIATICILCVIMAAFTETKLCKENYDSSNKEPFKYLKENMQDGDIFICSQNGGFSGFVVSANFPNNFLYFWDAENWNVEEAYKAFGKEMKTIYSLDEIENVSGRIWVLDSGSFALLEDIEEKYNVNIIQQVEYNTAYHSEQYSFSLIEKVGKGEFEWTK